MIHPLARPAALASLCAEEQGVFEVMHQFLYVDTSWAKPDTPEWNTIAVQAGVPDTAAFGACMKHQRVAAQLDTSIAVGHELRIMATPTFLSKNGFLERRPSIESFSALLGLTPTR
jgi:protein-disulfide isomerase